MMPHVLELVLKYILLVLALKTRQSNIFFRDNGDVLLTQICDILNLNCHLPGPYLWDPWGGTTAPLGSLVAPPRSIPFVQTCEVLAQHHPVADQLDTRCLQRFRGAPTGHSTVSSVRGSCDRKDGVNEI